MRSVAVLAAPFLAAVAFLTASARAGAQQPPAPITATLEIASGVPLFDQATSPWFERDSTADFSSTLTLVLEEYLPGKPCGKWREVNAPGGNGKATPLSTAPPITSGLDRGSIKNIKAQIPGFAKPLAFQIDPSALALRLRANAVTNWQGPPLVGQTSGPYDLWLVPLADIMSTTEPLRSPPLLFVGATDTIQRRWCLGFVCDLRLGAVPAPTEQGDFVRVHLDEAETNHGPPAVLPPDDTPCRLTLTDKTNPAAAKDAQLGVLDSITLNLTDVNCLAPHFSLWNQHTGLFFQAANLAGRPLGIDAKVSPDANVPDKGSLVRELLGQIPRQAVCTGTVTGKFQEVRLGIEWWQSPVSSVPKVAQAPLNNPPPKIQEDVRIPAARPQGVEPLANAPLPNDARQAFDQFRDSFQGKKELLQPNRNPLPTKGAGNGLLYTSEMFVCLALSEPNQAQRTKDQAEFCQIMRDVYAEQGLLNRNPPVGPHDDQDSPDDYFGVATAAGILGGDARQIAADIWHYGNSHGWIMNNVHPGDVDKERSALFVRFLSLQAVICWGAGGTPPAWLQQAWAADITRAAMLKHDAPGNRIIQWLQIQALPLNADPVCHVAASAWWLRYRQDFPGGIRQMFSLTLSGTHPLARFSVEREPKLKHAQNLTPLELIEALSGAVRFIINNLLDLDKIIENPKDAFHDIVCGLGDYATDAAEAWDYAAASLGLPSGLTLHGLQEMPVELNKLADDVRESAKKDLLRAQEAEGKTAQSVQAALERGAQALRGRLDRLRLPGPRPHFR